MDFLIPTAYAFPGDNTTTGVDSTAFNALLQKVIANVVMPVIYLIMALAIVYFLYGVFQFVQNADNPDKRKEGYQHMIWGIVGLFVMFSAQGIINIILSTLGL